MSEISLIVSNPLIELSSSLPTKGETYVAPALAARTAWAASKINVTLIFDAAQAVLAAKAGARYVSPFVGRLDDNSVNGLDVIKDISEIYQAHWVKTEILSASIRGVKAVSTSFALGAQVCTIPPGVFEKMYNHVLTDKGLQLFDQDYQETLKTILRRNLEK